MTRLAALISLVFFAFTAAVAQSRAAVEAYVNTYKATALRFEKEYGIPAPITLAQGILESAAGTSSLTRACNNHFCIKAGSSWRGPVHQAWDDEPQKSRFRAYSSADESFRDYARLLSTSATYRSLFSLSVYDYRGWAHGLKKAGYATAPRYAQALIGIIDLYRLYAVNGGAKLRPGKTVVITRVVDVEQPVFDSADILADDEASDEETEAASAALMYAVEINDIRCTVVQPGQDLAAVARKYDISPAELMRFNEIASAAQVHEGDIVFLDRKKKKYTGPQDVYIAAQGETLRDVAQKFGMQLRSLARLNGMSEYSLLEKGTKLYLK